MLAACGATIPPVPRDGPAVVASTVTELETVIDVAIWPDGEVVFWDGSSARHGRIDPAQARAIILDTGARVAHLPKRTSVMDGEGEEDETHRRIAVRTRTGYRVVELHGDYLRNPDARPFLAAFKPLTVVRPVYDRAQERAFPGEAGIRRLLHRPGDHPF